MLVGRYNNRHLSYYPHSHNIHACTCMYIVHVRYKVHNVIYSYGMSCTVTVLLHGLGAAGSEGV